jgi:hypothetical protein
MFKRTCAAEPVKGTFFERVVGVEFTVPQTVSLGGPMRVRQKLPSTRRIA